jgi:hypothetical protein
VALILKLIGADWEPVFVDIFGQMVQRTPEYRETVNEWAKRRCCPTVRRSCRSRASA